MKNCGDVPMKRAGEINRVLIADRYGWSVEEIYKAAQAFKQLHRRQPSSTLTFREYLDLHRDQTLRPASVGKSMDQYQLARYGDSGDYRIGNCRFIPALENQIERAPYAYSQEQKAHTSVMAKNRRKIHCSGCGRDFQPGPYAHWHGPRCKELVRSKHP